MQVALGGTGMFAEIDEGDAILISGYRWTALRTPRITYAISTRATGSILMHRLLLKPGHLEVDHIDSNGLNNRRSNLRVCTRSENARNQRTPITNTSGFKGVQEARRKKQRKWFAQVRLNGKAYRSKCFASIEEALSAHKQLARELHGAFARA